MPKRLAIASDGFLAKNIDNPAPPNHNNRNGKNVDKVLFLKLDDDAIEEKETKARFSFKAKEGDYYDLCGFDWD